MDAKLSILMLATLFSCAAQARDAAQESSDGWRGFLLDNVTFQQSTQDALRNRHSPFRPDLVTDQGGRLQNLFALQFKQGDWTVMGSYADNRTLGGGSAYSLTNPMAFGVNTVETVGTSREAVDYKSGLHELAATYLKGGTMVMLGKIDTSNWYLADPIFGGDLNHGNDYGNAATRVVAPPFPSVALVVKQDYGNGLSLTGIAGDAFGDRETLDAARNLVKGDPAYVVELNFQDQQQHYQLTFNHIDAFRFFDKDAVWPVPGEKAPQVNAVMASASYRFNKSWAGFGRASYAKGEGQLEDVNFLVGMRYDLGKFYALVSQSATRVGTDNTPYQQGAKGDITFVSELTLNYKLNSFVTLGMTYDMYHSSGDSLLAKDGGWNGAKRNQVMGLRVTSFLPF
ncbi:hypothetical protein F5985_10380 [Malikia spinosa]|uniref:Porin n=2 Tax=Malikia spinosa TaxID=86180 RepID=A0A7C9IY30_9BURK|nr:hypothetical protein [Malikia spinosa]